MINKLVDLSSDFGFQSVQNSSALQSFLERLICPHAPKELSLPLSTGSPKAFFVQIHRLKTRSNACPMSRRRTWFMQAFGNSTKLHTKKTTRNVLGRLWSIQNDDDLYVTFDNESFMFWSFLDYLARPWFLQPKASGEPVCGRLYLAANDNSLSLSLASALLLSRHVFQFVKLEFHTREIVFHDVMLCIKSTNRSIVIKRRSALMMTSLYRRRKRKSSRRS
jgi:hypothetical protein